MSKMLTAIEKLDRRFPGLAAKVRTWFDQGVGAQEVARLLREQYQVSVPRTTVGNFRTRRWARERELRQAREAAAAATAQFTRMQELKAASGAGFAAGRNEQSPAHRSNVTCANSRS